PSWEFAHSSHRRAAGARVDCIGIIEGDCISISSPPWPSSRRRPLWCAHISTELIQCGKRSRSIRGAFPSLEQNPSSRRKPLSDSHIFGPPCLGQAPPIHLSPAKRGEGGPIAKQWEGEGRPCYPFLRRAAEP